MIQFAAVAQLEGGGANLKSEILNLSSYKKKQYKSKCLG